MLCATTAVACLASFMLQWSRELPVQRSLWEQDLFGDLAAPVTPLSQEKSDETPPTAQEPVASQAHPVDHQRNEPILVEVLPNRMRRTHATPLAQRSAGSQPRFIQPVRHQQPVASPTAWLSGGIELLNDDPAPAIQPGTRYFPDAHRQ